MVTEVLRLGCWSSVVWLNKHVLLQIQIPRTAVIPNKRVNLLYKVVEFTLAALLIARTLFTRQLFSDSDISNYMYSQLEIGSSTHNAMDDLLSMERCIDLEKYDYWRSNAEVHKYEFHRCVPSCEQAGGWTPGSNWIKPSCFGKRFFTKEINNEKAMIVTHATLEDQDFLNFGSDVAADYSGVHVRRRENYWMPLPEYEIIKFQFGFNAPTANWLDSLMPLLSTDGAFHGPKADASTIGKSFDTFVLQKDGRVYRKVEKGKEISFSLQEMFMLAGEPNWLDTIRPEAGRNYKPDTAHPEGPIGRLSGGTLHVYIMCHDHAILSDFQWDKFSNFYECHIQFELLATPWEYNEHIYMMGPKVHRIESRGIQVVPVHQGRFHYINSFAVALQIIAFFVILRIPTWMTRCFLLNCLGLLSKIYHNLCFESVNLEQKFTGMIARLIQVSIYFVGLVDHKDEKGMDSISRDKMMSTIAEVLESRHIQISKEDLLLCIDYVFLMTVKAQIEEQHAQTKRSQKMQKRAEKKARAAGGGATSMDEQGEKKEGTLKRRKHKDRNNTSLTQLKDMNQILKEIDLKKKKLQAKIARLGDTFSGIPLSRVAKAIKGGIHLGGFSREMFTDDKPGVPELLDFLKARKNVSGLEAAFTPAVYNTDNMRLLIARGHNLSRGRGRFTDEDNIHMLHKLDRRKHEAMAHQLQMQKLHRAEEKEEKEEREAAMQQEYPMEEDEAMLKLSADFRRHQLVQRRMREEHTERMHQVLHDCSTLDMALGEINKEIDTVMNFYAQRQQSNGDWVIDM